MVTRPPDRAIEHEKTAVAGGRGAGVGKYAEDIGPPPPVVPGPEKPVSERVYDP
jgi:hypothetical protein